MTRREAQFSSIMNLNDATTAMTKPPAPTPLRPARRDVLAHDTHTAPGGRGGYYPNQTLERPHINPAQSPATSPHSAVSGHYPSGPAMPPPPLPPMLPHATPPVSLGPEMDAVTTAADNDPLSAITLRDLTQGDIEWLPENPSTYNYGTWTAADDKNLLTARQRGQHWLDLQRTFFPSKTANACRKRYERLMERRGAYDVDSHRIERMSKEYMNMRKEIWSGLAARVGEKWHVVEAQCMSVGLKNIQSNARSYTNRWRRESRLSQKSRPFELEITGLGQLSPVGVVSPLNDALGHNHPGNPSNTNSTLHPPISACSDAEAMPPPPFLPISNRPPPLLSPVSTSKLPFAGYMNGKSSKAPTRPSLSSTIGQQDAAPPATPGRKLVWNEPILSSGLPVPIMNRSTKRDIRDVANTTDLGPTNQAKIQKQNASDEKDETTQRHRQEKHEGKR
ncbi:hypothetical protein B0H63DRAFT_76107 [Podospora didyma]|uniref:Myb-like domain-containing protein n=1 Tax=Podospora didyma TaxID=330526 RepID=A0AAE0K1V5_9PEZI|nr:hypothetical protein B0H63DRAFT_76107 [Podospora didyma]